MVQNTMMEKETMKKGLIILLVVALLIILIGGWTVRRYNKMQTLKVNVNGTWSQVENQYIVVFPNNLLASVFGISQMPFFQAVDSAELAPTVNFN